MALINEGQVLLDLPAADRRAATLALATTLVDSGRCTDIDAFLADVTAREETMATGLPGGLAIPHARSAAITEPSLVFGRLAEAVDWGAKDGPASLVFLIAAPEGADEAHMKVLPQLARALMKKEFTGALAAATTPAEVVAIVSAQIDIAEEAPAPAAEAPAAEAPAAEAPAASLTLLGVTSCPTGIAHTYMAAEALERAAKDAGHTMTVETQGAAGSTPFTAEQLATADAVIFAHDVEVKGRERFAALPTIDVPVKRAISDAPALIASAVAAAAEAQANPSRVTAPAASGLVTKVDAQAGLGTRLRQWLMTGVSYMIPFVAAGGILIALSFMLSQISLGDQGPIEIVKYNLTSDDSYNIAQNFSVVSLTSWAALMFVIGGAAFGFLVPILSGFVAYAIADRPGLVPGIVGGAIAVTMNAGFIGGLVTGILGGLMAKWISSWKVHKGVRGVMPVVVTPLLSTFITLALFITVLGRPIAWLMTEMTNGLHSLTGVSAALLGAILGAMMGFDFGGPVNKVAYAFATAGLITAGAVTSAPEFNIMAAVMAAGMVAPLAMALSTVLRPRFFTEVERENGKAAWLLGASFISEGAIPFAAADPARVITGSVVGSAVTGALAMAFGVSLRAPHGGIWVLPLMGNVLGFLAALVVGVLVMTAIVLTLKSRARTVVELNAAVAA